MNIEHEQLELSEDVLRHVFSPGEASGLALIRTIPELSAKARGNCLILDGPVEKIAMVKRFLSFFATRLEQDELVDNFEFRRLFNQFTLEAPQEPLQEDNIVPFSEIITSFGSRTIRAKTFKQQEYVDAIEKNTITVARGPAGTGKTFLATAMAIKALKEKKVSRVILSRPVVEAGESLGYLPGDIKEKVDPHFRPLYDSLQEFIGLGKFEQFLRQGIIEITPLAYMRGRTFNEAFVVLDEAQNTTMPQMRMILTRLGYGSKMVITGDHTQIDLPRIQDSSLLTLDQILGKVPSLCFVDLSGKDVIRHEIVRRIIEAFDTFKNLEKGKL